jgi:hypothetical protein
MAYYLAASLVSLRNEVNAAHPDRDKTSDGWIGDASHAARTSDHNPDYASGGVVRAIDIDHDGIDRVKLRRVAAANSATEYIIQDGYIYTRQNGFRAAIYTGANKHDKHTHISIRHTKEAEAARKWGYVAGSVVGPSTPAGRKPTSTIVSEVIAGQWGDGPDRVNRLRSAGYDPTAIQAEVNRRLAGGSATAPPAPARKSVDQLAQEVIDGKWGNNPERSRRLQAAGYSATQVQAAVNRRLGSSGSGRAVRLSVEALADQVINQQWGNGTERRRRLTAAGYNYNAVQAEVNRRLLR